jgi:hypothetical protein
MQQQVPWSAVRCVVLSSTRTVASAVVVSSAVCAHALTHTCAASNRRHTHTHRDIMEMAGDALQAKQRAAERLAREVATLRAASGSSSLLQRVRVVAGCQGTSAAACDVRAAPLLHARGELTHRCSCMLSCTAPREQAQRAEVDSGCLLDELEQLMQAKASVAEERADLGRCVAAHVLGIAPAGAAVLVARATAAQDRIPLRWRVCAAVPSSMGCAVLTPVLCCVLRAARACRANALLMAERQLVCEQLQGEHAAAVPCERARPLALAGSPHPPPLSCMPAPRPQCPPMAQSTSTQLCPRFWPQRGAAGRWTGS